MKALKSELARVVLADPKATHQLRVFLATGAIGFCAPAAKPAICIDVEVQGRPTRLRLVRVPKAGK